MKGYIIIDGDSITGMPAIEYISQLRKMSDIEIEQVMIASKQEGVLLRFKESFSKISSRIKINLIRAASLSNHSDMLCAVWAGIYIDSIIRTQQDAMIFIASNDKLVLDIGSQVQAQGIALCILDQPLAPGVDYKDPHIRLINLNPKGYRRDIIQNNSKVSLPPWAVSYLSEKQRKIGLRCLAVPTEERHRKPVFIPFPETKNIVIVGKEGDISLSVWDVDQGLYPRNVEFTYNLYPKSIWTIRSLKGFRRGTRQISLNGEIIHANTPPMTVSSGDMIDMGKFSFRFITDKKEELIRYESPETIILQIEKSLLRFVQEEKAIQIPYYIENELVDNDGCINWELAYLRHYRKLIAANWSIPSLSRFRSHFYDKAAFNQEFIALTDLRNKVMHPSKQETVTPEEKELLADFFIFTGDLIPE